RLARLIAEAEGLRRLLIPPPDTGEAPPVLTVLQVEPGFEAAIGAAFGDELQAPLANDEGGAAARFWVDLGGDEHGCATLPAGTNHANPPRRRGRPSRKERRRSRRSEGAGGRGGGRSGGPPRGEVGPRGARPGARCGG